MESLKFPQAAADSQQEVLRRLHACVEHKLVAHVRILLVAADGSWSPTCARIDVARREEDVFPKSRPSGPVRLLTEVVELSDLTQRLEEAFAKEPFRVAGERLTGHGMEAAWVGMHYTDNWGKFATPWPLFHLYSNQEVRSSTSVFEVIESEDGNEAYDGLRDCIQSTMHFIPGRGDDARFTRFQIVEWDYRGVLNVRLDSPRRAVITVRPPDDPNLKLSYVAYDGEEKRSAVFARPSEVVMDTIRPLGRICAALRHGGTLVCEDAIDLWPQAAAGADAVSHMATDASLTAQLLLDFMQDKARAEVVSCDLVDFDAAVRGGSKKGALVLGGAILETVVTDVLLRNPAIAKSYQKKQDLSKAGLAELVSIAGKINVRLADGTTMPLLRSLTTSMADVLIEHRDLIHAEAQIRANARIDAHAVRVIHGLLGAVIQDFREAHSKGALDEWSKGNIVP